MEDQFNFAEGQSNTTNSNIALIEGLATVPSTLANLALNQIASVMGDSFEFLAPAYQQLTINAYSPGSDLAIGFRQNQSIFGREGNDTLVGLDPVADNPNQLQIDTFIGDAPILPPTQPNWSDKFNLGDWRQPYYANNGLNDFAEILDFNPSQDIIQLHGNPENYQLVESSTGTEILWQQETVTDRIAFLPSVYGLNLGGDYFQFEGNTPPPGPVLRQTQQLGTDGSDLSISSATDTSGNVFLTGGTTGDLGGSNAGSRDAWIAKYDSSGNQSWIRQFGSSSFDTGYGIATDNQGNSYMVGYTEGDLAGTKQAEFSDVWLAKYDSNGNQVWIQQFGSDVTNLSVDIDVDDTGNVYLSGLNVEADQSSIVGNTDDYFVTKYDTNGNRQWYTEYGSPRDSSALLNFDESYGVAVGSDGSVYTTGWTYGDLAGENAGAYDVWVSKQDNNGNQQWIQQFGTETLEFSWDVDTDSQGNSYAIGWTQGDLGGLNAGSYDAWLAKYDTNGNQVWVQQLGTSGDDEAFGVEIGLDDSIFLTGYTDNNLGGTNAGFYDAWVAKYDTNGNQAWIQQFGTPELDQAYGLTSDNANNLYVTGVTEGSLGDANAGSIDSWVAKLDATSGTLQDFNLTSDSVPGGNMPTDNSGDDDIIASVINQMLSQDLLTGISSGDSLVGFQDADITTGGGSDTLVNVGNTNSDFATAGDRLLNQIFASPDSSSTTLINDYAQLLQLGDSTEVQNNQFGNYDDILSPLALLGNATISDLIANNSIS